MITEVKIRVKTAGAENSLPEYQHEGDAGLDLRAAEETRIEPGRRALIKTGISLALPPGVVGLIKDRSGLALKTGLHTLAGVIDSNYRGEVKVLLVNLGENSCLVEKGERIAQMILMPCLKANLEKVSSLSATTRNKNGFGSTGKQ